jgi:CheY-like chemotaxis protein
MRRRSQHRGRFASYHCEPSNARFSSRHDFEDFGICAQTAMKIRTQEMRGNSQLLQSANPHMRKNFIMKIPVMLLLTNDSELKDSIAEALSALGGMSHLTRDAGDALETVCGVHDLDLAVIDFEHGPHGMTLLSAITMLREGLPVIVVARDDDKHVEALAYANGATACFPKPISAMQLASAIRELQRLKSELTPA